MTAIRIATERDLEKIRKLPRHLTIAKASNLLPKLFRDLLEDQNRYLMVWQEDKEIKAFLNVAFRPSADSHVKFLVLDQFSIDRFAIRQGIAEQLESEATRIAKEHKAVAIILGAARISEENLAFYQALGYTLNGESLSKKLEY